MPECVKNTAKLFADDLELIVNANMYDTVIDDLDQLEQWENRWLLKFNPSKCKVLHINENNNPMHCYELDETGSGENTAMALLVSITLSAGIDLIIQNKFRTFFSNHYCWSISIS